MRTPRRQKYEQNKTPQVNHAYDTYDSMWRSARFGIFIVRQMADIWGCDVSEACRRMESIGELEDDVIRFYDILHTQGTGYILPDIKRKWENANVR